MNQTTSTRCTAFEGFHQIASGNLSDVAIAAKSALDRGQRAPVLIFDDETSELVELDLRGTNEDVERRITAAASAQAQDRQAPRGPGRPKLGVVAREVTLLPRHWDWLNGQPGGASVTLRKLVEQARRSNRDSDRLRLAKEAAYRFIVAIAGDLPGFEEATRSLFANDPRRFDQFIADWPPDVQAHARQLAARSFH